MSSSDTTHSRSRLEPTTERVTFRATDAQLEGLETLVDDDVFPNRSEAIRAAIDELVTAETRGDSE
ncbi:ribbon-helix-helix domain-containing protein [Halomontanus rarus]|uniref:ribbon-helix-helix domain-containing protein n=1 Tax=Halomontanus rarus TaxID=3034020 RepID=UPI00307B3A5E